MTGSIDRNQLLYAIAAYNFANFRVKGFDLDYEEIGSLTLFTINGFSNFNEIIEYYHMIYRQGGYASTLDGDVTFFPISDENYNTLMHGKTLEEYMTFFIENYGKTAPDLVNRWRVRVDTDRKAAEAEKDTEMKKMVETEKTIENGAISTPETETPVKKESETITPETKIIEPVKTLENKEKKPIETEQPIEQTKESALVIEPPVMVTEGEGEGEERPAAKRENIFRKLFKRVKETDEFKKIKEGINIAKELAAEEELPVDSAAKEKPLERVDGELTFEQIQEIRRREAEDAAIKKAEETLSKNETQKAAENLKKQQAKERERLRKEKEKATKERLKQKEIERKQKEKQSLKQKKAERKQKEKDKKAAQKQKTSKQS
jgi:hypothetical protein